MIETGGGVESETRKELSVEKQSLIAAGNVDSLGVAPGPPDLHQVARDLANWEI